MRVSIVRWVFLPQAARPLGQAVVFLCLLMTLSPLSPYLLRLKGGGSMTAQQHLPEGGGQMFPSVPAAWNSSSWCAGPLVLRAQKGPWDIGETLAGFAGC